MTAGITVFTIKLLFGEVNETQEQVYTTEIKVL